MSYCITWLSLHLAGFLICSKNCTLITGKVNRKLIVNQYRNQVWVRGLSLQNLARVIRIGHLLHEAWMKTVCITSHEYHERARVIKLDFFLAQKVPGKGVKMELVSENLRETLHFQQSSVNSKVSWTVRWNTLRSTWRRCSVVVNVPILNCCET